MTDKAPRDASYYFEVARDSPEMREFWEQVGERSRAMNDGGMLYWWKKECKHLIADQWKDALVRRSSSDDLYLEPVCTLAEYLGVELHEPDDKIDAELVREYVANSAAWRGRNSTPEDHATRAAAQWLRLHDAGELPVGRCRHWAHGEQCWGLHKPGEFHESDSYTWRDGAFRDKVR